MEKQKAYQIVLEDLVKDPLYKGVMQTDDDIAMMPGIMATIHLIADEAYGDKSYSDMIIDIMCKHIKESMERMAHGK